MLSREVNTLECVHHPHILRLFEVVETLGRVHLVTEWVPGGELYDKIINCGALTEKVASNLFKQVVLAVRHMHYLGFVHRDIKAENVLLVSDCRVKLADFGFSTQLLNGPRQQLDTFCGSPPYAAPELFSDDHYIGSLVDIWALGVLLYFMVGGHMPFRAPTVPALRASVLAGHYTMPSGLSLPCTRLIERILIHVPEHRPSIDLILGCDWFNECFLPQIIPPAAIRRRSLFSLLSNKNHRRGVAETQITHIGNIRIDKTRKMSEKDTRHEQIHNDISNLRKCTTKGSNSVLYDNFLNPYTSDSAVIDLESSNFNSQSISAKKSVFQNTNVKKKIVPIDDIQMDKIKLAKKNSIDVISQKSILNPVLTKEDSIDCNFITSTNMFNEEQGTFIMQPTATQSLVHLNALEVKTRHKLLELGITGKMLCNAIEAGPRSDIIGAYRVIIHRLQREEIRDKEEEIMTASYSKIKKTTKTCDIL